MKTKMIILALTLGLFACGGSKSKPVSVTNTTPQANGHYIVEPFVLEGDCGGEAQALELIIYNGDLYDNTELSLFEIEGQIRGTDVTGIAFNEDITIQFDMVWFEEGTLAGDWYAVTGECHGYLSGYRI